MSVRIRILCDDGPREVDAEIFGNLAVNANFHGGFVITHIPTGRRIFAASMGREKAMFFAAEMSKSEIWEFTEPEDAARVVGRARALWSKAARVWSTRKAGS